MTSAKVNGDGCDGAAVGEPPAQLTRLTAQAVRQPRFGAARDAQSSAALLIRHVPSMDPAGPGSANRALTNRTLTNPTLREPRRAGQRTATQRTNPRPRPAPRKERKMPGPGGGSTSGARRPPRSSWGPCWCLHRRRTGRCPRTHGRGCPAAGLRVRPRPARSPLPRLAIDLRERQSKQAQRLLHVKRLRRPQLIATPTPISDVVAAGCAGWLGAEFGSMWGW